MFIYPTFGNVCSELVGMKTYSPILGLSTLPSTTTSISPSARIMAYQSYIQSQPRTVFLEEGNFP